MPRSTLAAFALVATALGVACHSTSTRAEHDAPTAAPAWRYVPDVPISRPPFSDVHANYKERLDQPYVYVELTGSYTQTGRALPELHRAVIARGVRASGPPFALFYDDPGKVSADKLRSRACLPVDSVVSSCDAFRYDVLPAATVVYAVAAGPYPDAPRAYAGLYRYMARMGWIENGPIREVYLVPPDAVKGHDELLCEIQIPAGNPP